MPKGVPDPKRPFIRVPKMLLMAATDGSGTANMAKWRLSRLGMSFLPPTAGQRDEPRDIHERHKWVYPRSSQSLMVVQTTAKLHCAVAKTLRGPMECKHVSKQA